MARSAWIQTKVESGLARGFPAPSGVSAHLLNTNQHMMKGCEVPPFIQTLRARRCLAQSAPTESERAGTCLPSLRTAGAAAMVVAMALLLPPHQPLKDVSARNGPRT